MEAVEVLMSDDVIAEDFAGAFGVVAVGFDQMLVLRIVSQEVGE